MKIKSGYVNRRVSISDLRSRNGKILDDYSYTYFDINIFSLYYTNIGDFPSSFILSFKTGV